MNCIQTDGFDLNILNFNMYEKHIKADTVLFEVQTNFHQRIPIIYYFGRVIA